MLMTKIQFYNWLNPGAKNKKKKKKKKKRKKRYESKSMVLNQVQDSKIRL